MEERVYGPEGRGNRRRKAGVLDFRAYQSCENGDEVGMKNGFCILLFSGGGDKATKGEKGTQDSRLGLAPWISIILR